MGTKCGHVQCTFVAARPQRPTNSRLSATCPVGQAHIIRHRRRRRRRAVVLWTAVSKGPVLVRPLSRLLGVSWHAPCCRQRRGDSAVLASLEWSLSLAMPWRQPCELVSFSMLVSPQPWPQLELKAVLLLLCVETTRAV
jgi:hypothetical protein